MLFYLFRFLIDNSLKQMELFLYPTITLVKWGISCLFIFIFFIFFLWVLGSLCPDTEKPTRSSVSPLPFSPWVLYYALSIVGLPPYCRHSYVKYLCCAHSRLPVAYQQPVVCSPTLPPTPIDRRLCGGNAALLCGHYYLDVVSLYVAYLVRA